MPHAANEAGAGWGKARPWDPAVCQVKWRGKIAPVHM